MYDSNGNKLSTSDTLVSGTEYIVVIKYNTENTGWGEIAIKGEKNEVKLGDVYFFSK